MRKESLVAAEKLKAGKYVLFCSQHPEDMRMSFKVKK